MKDELKKKAKIVWFTGLSGAGKSTLSKRLKSKLNLLGLKKIIIIDGDKFRKKTKNKSSFTKKNIEKNNISIINHIKKIQDKYNFILVSVISPLRKTRLIAKKKFENNYYEILVFCNLKVLKKRDTKGLYKKADKNEISNLIGYKSKINYQKTLYKKLKIDSSRLSPRESIAKILKFIF